MTRHLREIAGGAILLALLPLTNVLDRRAARRQEGD